MTDLENHLKSLKTIEMEMFEQVFNIVLNIPDNIVVSIPSLKSPVVVNELKRMRQKIKNKIKIGMTRLKNDEEIMNEYSKPSTSNTNTSSQNEQFTKKYGSTCADNSSTSSTLCQSFNNSNTNPNRWFENHSDFQGNTTVQTKIIPGNPSIYDRERLSVNELENIVNDTHFDTLTGSDIWKPNENYPVTNNVPISNTYNEGIKYIILL